MAILGYLLPSGAYLCVPCYVEYDDAGKYGDDEHAELVGAEGEGKQCANCGKVLLDADD